MGAFLIDHPPARSQFAARTNWSRSKITGCTVLHTAEGVMDTVGPDTGAENVAAWIARRADPGSYHDLVDSDSGVWLVPYHLGAYHDGTGSNGFATSISFACRTSDWRRMTPAKRRGFLWQGALAFRRQQAWRKANGHPLTELRYITKAQSDAGWSGFCCHGWRDPVRRTDPGIEAPNLFPFDEWLDVCLQVMSGKSEEDDMSWTENLNKAGDDEKPAWALVMQDWSGTSPAFLRVFSELAGLRAAFSELAKAVTSGSDVDPKAIEQAAHTGSARALKELIDSAEVTLSATQPSA